MDRRSVLEAGTELWLQEGNGVSQNWHRFRIMEMIGEGANCITYNAVKYGSYDAEHLVRLKEYFPYFGCRLMRDEENSLIALSGERKWEEKKRQFEETYKNHVNLQKEIGLINSSVKVSELLKGNHTLYMVIEFDEGVDYARILEETVVDTLTVAGAVAQVLEYYHQKGYLYLDLKPENILILPETREHIKLLDFDTVVAKKQILLEVEKLEKRSFDEWPEAEEQMKCQLILGGTPGYSAPEQLDQELEQISECTDIFSVGAVVFAKLMGRTAEIKDGRYHADYDFEPIKRMHQNLQPDFFGKLEEFFRKTLSISVFYRFQRMEEVKNALKELISLADETIPFVCDNFICHQSVFVGREKELREIGECFLKDTLLFLHGIGGIGKSELARQYAKRNRRTYRTIVFVNFQNSIFYTVCSEEISIANLKRGEEETEEDYFTRKLQVMREDLRSEDLLILDNFDVEVDAHLELLLTCKCHFLITSREDFSDWGFPQMEIREIKQTEELLELFCSYHRKTDWYRKEEWEAVEALLEWADRHTMTIELMAKYLRISGSSPCDYRKKLQSVEGITSTGLEAVKHRKDNRMTLASVEKHLQAVFDVSGITEQGKLVLRSLSLFGTTRIQKEVFLCWCKDAEEGALQMLFDRGWVLYDKQSGKIALHQIILDMVYSNLKPDSENCAGLIESITELMQKEWNSRMERSTIKRLIQIVAKRICGNNQQLVWFYLNCCKWIGKKREYLEFCISYCQEHWLKEELSESYCYYAESLWEELIAKCIYMDQKEQCTMAEEIAGIFEKAIAVSEKPKEKTVVILKKIEKLLYDSEFFVIEDVAKDVLRDLVDRYLAGNDSAEGSDGIGGGFLRWIADRMGEQWKEVAEGEDESLLFPTDFIDDLMEQNTIESFRHVKKFYGMIEKFRMNYVTVKYKKSQRYYQKRYQAAVSLADKMGMIKALFGESQAYLEEYECTWEKAAWDRAWSCCEEAWKLTESEVEGADIAGNNRKGSIPIDRKRMGLLDWFGVKPQRAAGTFDIERMRLLDWFGSLCDAQFEYEQGDRYRMQCDYYRIAEEDSDGKVGEESDEVWIWAAKKYRDILKKEDAVRCFEKIRELSIPEKADWTVETDAMVGFYLGNRKQEIECLLDLGRKEEAGAYLGKITEILWKWYRSSFQGGYIREVGREFSQVSKLYGRYGNQEERIRLMILAGLIRLNEEDRKEGMERLDIWEAEELLERELEEKTDPIEGRLLDELIEILEQIVEGAGQEERFSGIGRRFAGVIQKWREKRISFS